MDELFEAAEPISVAVLGSTGSIGRQALEVCRSHPDTFRVVALAAARDAEGLLAQVKEFRPELMGLAAGDIEGPSGVEVVAGPRAAAEVAASCNAQVILNAVVGAAGLQATLAVLESGRALALANKESLVAGGELVMAKASPGQIRPVDSEHSAMWQLLDGIAPDTVRRAIIPGTGGPFRGRTPDALSRVGVAEALAHPVWDMGPKITIDSATLMNKGLEVIEAHFLFGLLYDEIQVVIHPQGMIHAMVETIDGAMKAHAALPDMRLPIQLALAWPARLGPPGQAGIDLPQTTLTFEAPDYETFPCLRLAYEAGRRGDTAPAAMNAANEAAVGAFLQEHLDFPGIPAVVEAVLEEHDPVEPRLDEILEVDAWARRRAEELILRRSS